MLHERFHPTFESLPGALPVFPLDSVIIMPGAVLPLNIFEPRYLNMIEDAFKSHHLIGMVQPRTESLGDEIPRLYETGCAGRITTYSETADGRMLISLTGVIRFDITEELASIRGYRQVRPDWKPYRDDLGTEWEQTAVDRQRLHSTLRKYLEQNEMAVEWQQLETLPDMRLINLMATLLPLDNPEKQAILEAPAGKERADVFLSAIEFDLHAGSTQFRH
jgi:Lon protease-like protein